MSILLAVADEDNLACQMTLNFKNAHICRLRARAHCRCVQLAHYDFDYSSNSLMLTI